MGVVILNGVPYSGYSEPNSIYSLTEKEVGVWIDGKPIYEKTWDFGSNIEFMSQGWNNTPIVVADFNISKIIKATSINDSGTLYDFLGANALQTYVQILQTRNASIVVRYLTLQYTKTTDQPGSGSYLPNGSPTHHYSTDEQVIGTWIDGKPLYEKTISTTFTADTNFSGEIKEGNIDISSFVSTAKLIFVDVDKCYYEIGSTSQRSFYAIICESENKMLNVYTRYARTNVTGHFVIQYTKNTD